MKNAEIVVNKHFKKSKIDPRIYSSFVEHMGRVIYSGIYEPEHPTADENGFRTDVIEKVKILGVTNIRYPGGNFVSCYDWRDGIGPKEKRPRKLEIAWRSVETNEFGVDEFMKWAGIAGVEPIFAVNLGTKGIENAVSFVEYCNINGGSYYSDLRQEYGTKDPYRVKYWCLGNEMDGDWQIGHKTAEEYGRLAQETAKAMKQVDPGIELISCGSSKSSMLTYPEWEATTLQHTYDYVDYISLHQYYDGQDKGTSYFLAQSIDMEEYIKTVISTCDYVKAKKRSNKTMYISFDEWGVWSMSDTLVMSQVDATPWQVAPAISEQIYSMEDALLFSSMMMNFLKYAGRIKIACQSLLTNISAAIITEPMGEVWVQTIFYPFSYMARYGRGTVLGDIGSCPTYDCEGFQKVPYIDEVVVYNEDEKELVYFIVNRDENESFELNCVVENFKILNGIEHVSLNSEDKKATNQVDHNRVHPVTVDDIYLTNDGFRCSVKPLSFNVIRVKVE